MKAALRTIAILTATLLIGALMGGAFVGRVVRARLTTADKFLTAEGFKEKMVELIDPEGATQASTIGPILDTHSRRVGDIVETARQDYMKTVGDLNEALEPHLTPLQRKRLREQSERMRERLEQRRARGRGSSNAPPQ